MNAKIRDLVELAINRELNRHRPAGSLPAGTLPAALFTAFKLELPKMLKPQVQKLACLLFKLKNHRPYRDRCYAEKKLSEASPSQLELDSFSSCLDLHVDLAGEIPTIKLIEYNTNAALMGLSYFIYEALGLTQPFSGQVKDLKKDLKALMTQANLGQATWAHSEDSIDKQQIPCLAILDTEPSKQNLYGDFLFYQKLFEAWGWKCEIHDTSQFSELFCTQALRSQGPVPFDLVINRDTDFFLLEKKHQPLRKAWEKGLVKLTPHPGDYCLFAEKSRMNEWQTQPELKPFLLKSQILSAAHQKELWAKRKKLFFKPSSSFGSKQAYKGSSISRKLFESLVQSGEQILAQELCEPLRFEVPTSLDLKSTDQPDPPKEKREELKKEEVKVDLRFYLFRDEVRSALARVYQGQVTNLQSPLAGFIPILWNEGQEIKLEPLSLS